MECWMISCLSIAIILVLVVLSKPKIVLNSDRKTLNVVKTGLLAGLAGAFSLFVCLLEKPKEIPLINSPTFGFTF